MHISNAQITTVVAIIHRPANSVTVLSHTGTTSNGAGTHADIGTRTCLCSARRADTAFNRAAECRFSSASTNYAQYMQWQFKCK